MSDRLSDEQVAEQQRAEAAWPNHHPITALANYRAGREVWDTNGDLR
jgi:hypothetical protein